MTELNSYTVTSNETISLSAVFFYHISIQNDTNLNLNFQLIDHAYKHWYDETNERRLLLKCSMQ